MDKIPVWLRSFIISFVILFSVSILIITWVIQRQQPAVMTTMQNEMETRYNAQSDEAFNAMLLFRKDEESPPDKILLWRLDACNNQMSLLDLPLDLQSTVNTKTKSLEKYCDLDNLDLLKKAVQNLFFIEIQRTVEITDSGLTRFIDYFGGLEWDAPEEINYQEMSGNTLTIEPGRQLIDGRRFCALIREDDAVSLFCAFGEQQLSNQAAGNFQKYRTVFSQNTKSDFTAYDYAFYENGITQMLKDHNAKVVIPKLEKEEKNNRTSVTDSSRDEIKNAFS